MGMSLRRGLDLRLGEPPEGRRTLQVASSIVPEGPAIHPTAVVEAGAEIGFASRVWHHAHVRSGAVVGSRCVLGKNVFVDAGAVIGDGVKIQNNVSVYVGVTIADDVFVGPSVTFTNDRVPRAFAADWQVTETFVDRGASIGANATIVCGVRIGAYAMVGAGSTVTRSVRDHELVVGTPARHGGWVCTCGHVVSRELERPAHLDCDHCTWTDA
jgi:acetyltransferase-like isoleucine patch superfamily enzyme